MCHAHIVPSPNYLCKDNKSRLPSGVVRPTRGSTHKRGGEAESLAQRRGRKDQCGSGAGVCSESHGSSLKHHAVRPTHDGRLGGAKRLPGLSLATDVRAGDFQFGTAYWSSGVSADVLMGLPVWWWCLERCSWLWSCEHLVQGGSGLQRSRERYRIAGEIGFVRVFWGFSTCAGYHEVSRCPAKAQ